MKLEILLSELVKEKRITPSEMICILECFQTVKELPPDKFNKFKENGGIWVTQAFEGLMNE